MLYRSTRFCWVLVAFLAFCAHPAWGQQSTTAQITGLVTDATGASVPGASVVAINTATNVEYPTETNVAGVYVLSNILPGPYTLTVSIQGFKTQVRTDLVVRIADRLGINFVLEPGEIRTTVEITATVEGINTSDASYSDVVDNQMVTALPQLSRSTLHHLAKITPAVQGEGPPQLSEDGAVSVGIRGTTFALAGGQRNGTLITVDGGYVQDTEIGNTNRAIPTPDAIEEFRVQTGVLPAEVGRYSGGVITVSTRSGTNEFHGRGFYYGRWQNLNSNTWRNNSLGREKDSFHQTNYGFSVGGPITIPKVYDGKNKTFFFFAAERERTANTFPALSSVPTLRERRGDFSQSIIAYQEGQPVLARIFDPFNGYEDENGNWVRPEFPGAVIPVEDQAALASYYMNLYPEPNRPPRANAFSSTENFLSSRTEARPIDRQTLRLDHNISDRHRVFARASHYTAIQANSAPFFHAPRQKDADTNWTGTLQYTWLPSPTSLLELRVGLATSKLRTASGSDGDPAIDTDEWPFDPILWGTGLRSDKSIPPGLYSGGFGGNNFHSSVGGEFFDTFTNNLGNASISYTRVVNRHTLKMGYQHFYAVSNEQGGDSSGVTYLRPGGGSNQFWDRADGLTGHPLAEIMLGSATFFNWGNWNIAPYGALQAAYIMDDWKVNQKLTLNLSLRYDHEDGRRPRYPYGVIWDSDAQNVISPNQGWDFSQVVQAVPEVANFPQPAWVTGGIHGRSVLIDTPEHPDGRLFRSQWGILQPRLGLSYQLDSATVFHASYGIINQGFSGLQTEIAGDFYYGTPTFNSIATLDGRVWLSELGLDRGLGPFPLQADGSRLGYFPPLSTNQQMWNQTLGGCSSPIGLCTQEPGVFDYPYEHIWGMSVQREVGQSWVVSVEYMGIRGVNLITPSRNIVRYTNVTPEYYDLGEKLLTPVPSPFVGQAQNFVSDTVPLHHLLSSAPHYTNAGPNHLTNGRSMSQFVNFQAKTRRFRGLSLLASYSIRKTLVNNVGKDLRLGQGGRTFQNTFDLVDEAYGVALYERPHQLLLNYFYEVPVGSGRTLIGNVEGVGAKILDAVFGGWGFAGITRWWPKGEPIPVPRVNAAVTAPGAGVRWSTNGEYRNPNVNHEQALVDINGNFVSGNPGAGGCHANGVFNCSAFVRTPDYSFGNLPIVYPNMRQPGSFETDATFFKNFYFSDDKSRYLNFRLEAENIFNHPNLGSVDRDPDSATFGGILGKSGQRVMQLGMRLFF